MFIYKIGRAFESDFYLVHETKFSQEEFNAMCEAVEKDEILCFKPHNKRYSAINIRTHLVNSCGFKELDSLCVCEFDKDEEYVGGN